MTSSMMTGEQRWASKRRSGMTVLGKVVKVAAPKPLNLPSQRLENHGLDPSVEIVPKGTLSWGSRPSSSGSNAWATSALSPSTDGGSSSPSHLAGRPVSGGGTRPSTAGSDKAPDSSSRGPNSRPSSASGVLGSNHTSLTSLRPRSADMRPGSSQLSRFAEHSPESSGAAWGPNASSERMGVNEGFSLTSGDFPTLGSEKDETRRNLEPLDASDERPVSSSGGGKSMPDSMEISHDDARDSDIQGHSWRKDGPPFVEGGPRPSMERWHGDPHLYQNPNMGPPHYDSWRGPPPVNPQGGVWYRGPPSHPPYGGPIPPGGFHMEPFPYYPPQVPPPGPNNSQSIPPGAGHHGHHPNNGDMYRPHMPESFIRPGMPMRPVYYPAPVHFEGYHHGPPMGFCNPNERDLPYMGMAGGPIYNRPPNHYAPDLNNSHPRSHEGRCPDQADPDHLHDPRGNYKVLMKRNDGWNQNDEEKWGHRVVTDGSDREKGILPRATLQENARGNDYKDRESHGYSQREAKDEVPSRHREDRFRSNNPVNSKSSGSISNVEDRGAAPVTDIRTSSRNHSLIQKVEVLNLNDKTHASGGNQDAFQEEFTESVQMVNDWTHQSVEKADTRVVLERHYPTGVLVPVSRDTNVVASERSGESVITAGPRRVMHGAPNRGNHHGKGNFDGQEVSGWGRKSQSHSVRSAGLNITTNDQVEDHNSDVRKARTIAMKVDGESALSGLDPNDTQRAKMREIAKQRAIQLQKEEEERIREQKAKALAKLEELNRRSAIQVTEASQKEIDESRNQPNFEANSIAGPNSDSSHKIAQIDEKDASKVVDSVSVDTPRHARGESKKNAQQDSVSSQNELSSTNVYVEDAGGNKIAAQVRDVSKHKRAGCKPRQNVPPEKNPPPKGVLDDNKGKNATQDINVGIKVDGSAGKELLEAPLVSESSAPQKRRHNKSGKNKHKVEDLSNVVSSTIPPPDKSELGQPISVNTGINTSDLCATADANEPSQLSGNHSSLSREDDHGRVSNSWKAQHSRKTKSSQGNRLSEKNQSNDAVVWAPVRSHNKVEVSPDQTSQKATEPLVSSSGGENKSQNSPKTKRAEIERYVPKPVAKELAQQGNNHQPSSLSVDRSQSAQASVDSSARSGGREKTFEGSDSVAKAVPVVEGKNRQSKGHGSWRQRVFTESNPAQASQSPMMTEPPNRPRQPTMKGPEADLSDGWASVNDSNSNSSAAGGKEQLESGRGKRHPFKGQKGNYQSAEHKDSNAGLPDSQSGSEVNHTVRTQFSKENKAALDLSASHWQPKSQVNVSHDQKGKWSRGGHSRVPDDNKGLKPNIGSGSGVQTLSHYNQSVDKAVKDTSHHEPNRGLDAETDPISSKAVDGNYEQRPSSGYRKNSNYGGRGNRVPEFRGDHHYSSANQQRPRPNTQYEYQAVGSYNESEPQTENQRGGTHFRGRGHSRRGRGNF